MKAPSSRSNGRETRDKYLNIKYNVFLPRDFYASCYMVFFTTRDMPYIDVYTFSIVQLYSIVRWKNRISDKIEYQVLYGESYFSFIKRKIFYFMEESNSDFLSGRREFYWHLYQWFSFSASIFTLRVFLEENSSCGFYHNKTWQRYFTRYFFACIVFYTRNTFLARKEINLINLYNKSK